MQATDEITVKLTAIEWNQVLAVLAGKPYRQVAPLIAKMQQQGNEQGNSMANGKDHGGHAIAE